MGGASVGVELLRGGEWESREGPSEKDVMVGDGHDSMIREMIMGEGSSRNEYEGG